MNATFVRLWIAGGIGNATLWLEVLAAGLFTQQATGSAFAVAVVSAARSLPLLGGAIIGALAETLDRRRIVLCGMLLAAGASATVAALAAAGRLQPWHLAVAALASGCVYATEMPARRRLIAESVDAAAMPRAVAVDSLTNFATRCAGPLLGGAGYAAFGMAGTFAGSATASLCGAVLVAGVAQRAPRVAVRLSAIGRELRQGWAFARGRRALLALLAVTVTMNLCGYSYTTLLVPIGREAWHLSAARIGVLAAAEPAGALLCGVVLTLHPLPGTRLQWLAGGAAALLAALVAASMAPPLWLPCFVLLTGGVGSAVYTNAQTLIVMEETPAALRSRVMGLLTVCIGSWPLGILLAGALTRIASPLQALAAMALLGLLALALVWGVGRRVQGTS